MKKEQALSQYSYEVSLFEAYGTTNVITFEDWIKIKGITLD
jgi:hypothetical protein